MNIPGLNTANLTSISRILLIPVILGVYVGMAGGHLLAAALFIIASISDWLDGYLARRLNQTSEFGAFIDPVADKLLVVCVLILLTSVHAQLLLPAVVIIAREVLVLALREWMASRGQRERVAVAFVGKLKTGVQMTAISALLLVPDTASPTLLWELELWEGLILWDLRHWLLLLGHWLLLLAAVLSLWSMVQYFRRAWKTLNIAP